MPILVLMSVVTAAYGWTYDQVVVLVAAVQVMVWLQRDTRLSIKAIAVGSYLVFSVLHLSLVTFAKLSDFWFVWLAPGWLFWYLTVWWLCRPNTLVEQTAS